MYVDFALTGRLVSYIKYKSIRLSLCSATHGIAFSFQLRMAQVSPLEML